MAINALRDAHKAGKAALAAAALALALLPAIAAQDAEAAAPAAADAASAADDEMFGAEETVVQAAESPAAPANQGGFLKYDQVKIGGSVTAKAGFTSAWGSVWDGGADFFSPDAHYISPDLEGKLTIVAKPSEDFGVNMDFRTSWPFSSTTTVASGLDDNLLTNDINEEEASVSVPNISIWALYSKFNWQDRIYFSFGKQPIAWGVAKGAFQPADDIFALSTAIDLEDTTAEREGPISLKTTIPLSATNNFYLYAGLPSNTDGSAEVDPADARLAAKVEYGFGNTELALGAFYSYNDYPRGLLLATTGLGNWNLYGEAIAKYGSERYFLTEGTGTWSAINTKSVGGDQESGKLYFTGAVGGYYSNADGDWSVALEYLYNGEAQEDVSFAEAYAYYYQNSDDIDRMRFGEHYAFASVTKTKIVKDAGGDSKLSASLIAIANLSDLSGYLMPSLTWSFFDYLSLKAGATFNFGEAGDEYIVYGVGQGVGKAEPGVALNLTLTMGTGSF
jgi:hypothetical protein